MQIPRRKIETLRALRTWDDGPIYLTPEGIEKLKERLLHLKKVLPDLIRETTRAADYGDRSDNAEYKDAKATLRRTNRHIMTIEEQLKRVVVIAPGSNLSGKVELGSTVDLESKEGVKKTFQILGPRETKPERGRISNKSPVGAALMHRKVGETVVIHTPSGSQEYRILEIR